MSLIDEALKRARMEAAQRAAEGEGLPYPTIPRHLGPRRRRAWLAPLVVALAVIAGLLIGWILATRTPRTELVAARGGREGAATEPPTATAVTSGPATPVEVTRDPVAADTDVTKAAEAPASVPPRIEEPTPSPAAPTEPSAKPVTSGPARPADVSRDPAVSAPPTAVTDPDSRVLLVLPERPRPSAVETGGEVSQEPTESYVQSYPLPNGGAIELGGIAWSETGPFALINGRVIGPGSVIDGYTVEGIRPGHVVLTANGSRVRLSLQ